MAQSTRNGQEVEKGAYQSRLLRLMLEANLRIQDNEIGREFWWGYLKGLSRQYHGQHYGTAIHEYLLRSDDSMGRGYREGLSQRV
jgi:hypothetical protein